MAGPTCLFSPMPFILRIPLDPAGAGPLQFPLMFVFTVYSSYEDCSQGWMSQSIRALASLPVLSLPGAHLSTTPPQGFCAEDASM